MTLKQLKEKVWIRSISGYSTYQVEIKYRGQIYSCKSNNSLAWDRINSDDFVSDRESHGTYTLKGAYMAFYIECMSKNGLGGFSIV